MRIIFLILTAAIALFWVTPVFANSLLINEFMAHPATGNNEWVEFYNPSGIDLTLYWLDDDTSFTDDSGSSTKKSLSALNTASSIYPYLEFSSFLNNGGDYVILFSSDGTIIDQYQYTSDPGTNVSIGRSPDGGSWVTLASSSKGGTNGSTSPSPSPSPSSSPLSSPSATSSSTSSSSTFTISNVPSQIDSTESFNVSVNLSLPNSPNNTFYLKGAFKKADSSNYFGLTKVSGSWIKNNKTYSDQYKVTTDSSGSWTGSLEIQPDILDSGYEGSGDYIFKVGRYTEGGSLTWSNEASIKINAQEVILEKEDDSEVLGAVEKQSLKNKPDTSKDREYSLEKYIKISSPSSSTIASATPEAEVKGEKQASRMSWIGILMILSGISIFGYVYLRNKKLREAIFNLLRKRN